MRSLRLLEACCVSADEARRAIGRGASRIELCAEIEVGGVTPSDEEIRAAVALGAPVNVLVRPRGGDFVYNAGEEEEMAEAISRAASLGAAGVVIGALREDGSIDTGMSARLVKLAKEKGLSVTFHRAFDDCNDPFKALEEIISLGCDRLLTSGQKPTAYEGRELLARLLQAAGNRIIIMPGAGITPDNLDELENITGAVEFHGTKICGK